MLVIVTLVILLTMLVSGLLLRYAKSRGVNSTSVALMLRMEGDTFFHVSSQHSLPYRLYVPQSTSKQKRYPLIVSLQSAYGRGSNNIGQLDNVVKALLDENIQQAEPAYVLAPQCPRGLEWNDSPPVKPSYVNIDMTSLPTSWRLQALVALIKEMVNNKPIDPQRIYLVGASMGATGIWSFLYRYPNLFAGAVIMNGRSDPATAKYIKTPVMVFHGKYDSLAPPVNSKTMVAALHALGKDSQLQLVEGGHDIASFAVTEESLAWLNRQRLVNDAIDQQFLLNPVISQQ
jgi:predicted peptidase